MNLARDLLEKKREGGRNGRCGVLLTEKGQGREGTAASG